MKEMAFLTLEQIAKILQVNKMTIYREIKRGKLKVGKFGKEFRISSADFEEYLHNAYKAAEQSTRCQHSCITPQRLKTIRKAKMTKQTASKTDKTNVFNNFVKKEANTLRTKHSKQRK